MIKLNTNVFRKTFFTAFVSILFIIFLNNIYAASISITTSKSSVKPGETFTATVTVNNGAGYVGASVKNGSGGLGNVFLDNSSQSFSCTAGNAGNVVISVNGRVADYTTEKDQDVATSKTVSIIKPKPEPKPQPKPENKPSPKPTNNSNNSNKTLSSNNFLSRLQVNQEGLEPAFNKNRLSYRITVGSNVEKLNVNALTEEKNAKISVSGNHNLKNGDNKIEIIVTAQNGNKRTYTITCTKTADEIKSDSYLENLIIEGLELTPKFSGEILEYDLGSTNLEKLNIYTYPKNEKAEVKVLGSDKLKDGDNVIKIIVTSEDKTTKKEYILKVKKVEKVDDEIVKNENIIEENSLIDTNNKVKGNGFKRFLKVLKRNWLVVLLYIFSLVELVQIIYLYCKLNKINLKDIFNVKKYKKEDNKKVDIDKTFEEKTENSMFIDVEKYEEQNKINDEEIETFEDNYNDNLYNNFNDTKSRKGRKK